METEVSDITLIQKFIDYELTEAELNTFKTKYEIDNTFRDEANGIIKLQVALRAISRVNNNIMVKSTLTSLQETIPEEPSMIKGKSLVVSLLLKAAAVLLPFFIISSVFLYFRNQSGLDRYELFEKSFDKQFIKQTEISNDQPTDPEIIRSFKGSPKTFKSKEANVNQVLLIYVVKNMKENNFGEAILALNSILGAGDKNFQDDAIWYLALCHLKLHEYKEAEDCLGKLSVQGNKYEKEAKELMKKIKILE